jgi:hypothetical protein
VKLLKGSPSPYFRLLRVLAYTVHQNQEHGNYEKVEEIIEPTTPNKPEYRVERVNPDSLEETYQGAISKKNPI